MEKKLSGSFLQNLIYDLPASLVVFLVAVPLCLGISLASGAPMLAGLIAGAIGGIVVGSFSGSTFSVSGPAAGLTSIVVASIAQLGSFQAFSMAVIIAGMLQIIMGYFNAGTLAHFTPSSVVKGMLAGIGIILILKQIPHALGDDMDYEGDETFFQPDDQNTITEIIQSIMNFAPGAIVITIVSAAILILWGSKFFKENKFLKHVPAPLIVVLTGIAANQLFATYIPTLALSSSHLVQLPKINSASEIISIPDWSMVINPKVYWVAITLAVVASLETLLSIEAADKMDPYRRSTPLNRELKAQGVANTFCGLIGGLSLTSVIVRTTTNITSGARSKVSTIFHGIWILLVVLVFPGLLEQIPLACLATILITIGVKLASPVLWKEMYAKGKDQFYPFAITTLAIVFSNLLMGIGIGIAVSIYFILKSNYRNSVVTVNRGNNYLIKFTRDTSFINKLSLLNAIKKIPNNSTVMLEGSSVQFIDQDIIETIYDLQKSAQTKSITIVIKKTKHALHNFFKQQD